MCYRHKHGYCLGWKLYTAMAIFTEIYSFRLHVVPDTKCCTGQSFIQFLWGTDWVQNKNMCLLDWVCRLIRNYKLLFSFKAATPCSINKKNASKNVVQGRSKTTTPIHLKFLG